MKLLLALISPIVLALPSPLPSYSSDQDPPPPPPSCPGCDGELELGTTTSAPGYTIGVKLGNESGDPSQPAHDPDGECHVVDGGCTQKEGCKFLLAISRKVPKGASVTNRHCTWVFEDNVWKWDCTTLTTTFTAALNGTTQEWFGPYDCGDDEPTEEKNKIELGPASLEFTLKCLECIEE